MHSYSLRSKRHLLSALALLNNATPHSDFYPVLSLEGPKARFINATDITIDGGRSQVYHD